MPSSPLRHELLVHSRTNREMMIPPLSLEDPSDQFFTLPLSSKSFGVIPRKPLQPAIKWAVEPNLHSRNASNTASDASIMRGESFSSDCSAPSMIDDTQGYSDSDVSIDEDRYHEVMSREWDVWHEKHSSSQSQDEVIIPLLLSTWTPPQAPPPTVLPAPPQQQRQHRSNKSDLSTTTFTPVQHVTRPRALTTTSSPVVPVTRARSTSRAALRPAASMYPMVDRTPPLPPLPISVPHTRPHHQRQHHTMPRRTPAPLSLYPTTTPLHISHHDPPRLHRDRSKSHPSLRPSTAPSPNATSWNETHPLPAMDLMHGMRSAPLEKSVFEYEVEEKGILAKVGAHMRSVSSGSGNASNAMMSGANGAVEGKRRTSLRKSAGEVFRGLFGMK